MPDEKESLIDLKHLNEYTDGDPEAIRDLLALFYESCEEGLQDLQAHICEGQSPEWCAAAHKLKGASAYVGALHLQALCAQAQMMQNTTTSQRELMYSKIKERYDLVSSILHKEYP